MFLKSIISPFKKIFSQNYLYVYRINSKNLFILKKKKKKKKNNLKSLLFTQKLNVFGAPTINC